MVTQEKVEHMERLLITDIDSCIGLHLKEKFYNLLDIYHLGCDIMDFQAVDNRINEIQPNYLIHICQQHKIKNRFEQDILGTKTHQGTVNLITAAKKLSNLKMFTFHSVYDDKSSLWDHSKFICEKIFEYESKDSHLPYCVLKLPTVYGDYRRPLLFNIGQHIEQTVNFDTDSHDFQIEDLIFEMKNQRKIIVNKNRSYQTLFIDDLIAFYEKIFQNTEAYQKTLQIIPYSETVTLKNLVAHAKLILANKFQIDIEFIEHDVIQSNVVDLSHSDWQTTCDYKKGLVALIDRINQFDRDFNGLQS